MEPTETETGEKTEPPVDELWPSIRRYTLQMLFTMLIVILVKRGLTDTETVLSWDCVVECLLAVVVSLIIGSVTGYLLWKNQKRAFTAAETGGDSLPTSAADANTKALLKGTRKIWFFCMASLLVGSAACFVTIFAFFRLPGLSEAIDWICSEEGGGIFGVFLVMMFSLFVAAFPLVACFIWMVKYAKNVAPICMECEESLCGDEKVARYVGHYMKCPKCEAEVSEGQIWEGD